MLTEISRQPLGRGGPLVSGLCLGTYTLTSAWADMDPAAGKRAVHAALDHGINFFDTARAYGRAERILGDVLRDAVEHRRSELVLCSKGGLDLSRTAGAVPFVRNSRPEHLRQGLQETLRRLGADHLDVFLLHWPDPGVPIPEAAGAMSSFVREGLVRHVGVSNFTVDQMREFATEASLDVAQIPCSLFAQQPSVELLPYLRAIGAGVMGYAALAQGFLTGLPPDHRFAPSDFRARSRDFTGEKFLRRQAVAEQLANRAAEYGRSLAEMAVAWVSAQGVVPVVGAGRVEHVVSCLRGLQLRLSPAELAEVGRIGASAPAMDVSWLSS